MTAWSKEQIAEGLRELDRMDEFDKAMGQVFENTFDCYADDGTGDSTIMAMTKDKFICVLHDLVQSGDIEVKRVPTF